MENLPDPYEVLDKNYDIIKEDNKKATNSIIYTFPKEDHTLGNLLQAFLIKNKNVKYAGYKKENPLKDEIKLSIITNGKETPDEALLKCISELKKMVDDLKKQFCFKLKYGNDNDEKDSIWE